MLALYTTLCLSLHYSESLLDRSVWNTLDCTQMHTIRLEVFGHQDIHLLNIKFQKQPVLKHSELCVILQLKQQTLLCEGFLTKTFEWLDSNIYIHIYRIPNCCSSSFQSFPVRLMLKLCADHWSFHKPSFSFSCLRPCIGAQAYWKKRFISLLSIANFPERVTLLPYPLGASSAEGGPPVLSLWQ